MSPFGAGMPNLGERRGFNLTYKKACPTELEEGRGVLGGSKFRWVGPKLGVGLIQHTPPPPHSLVTAYLVRGLPSWHVRCAAQLNISLPVEPLWHHGDPVLLIVSPPAALYWALALLAQAGVPPLWAGVALLTVVPPGDSTLALPQPMTPYACGALWVYTTAGVSHRWALTPAAATQ